MSEQTEQDQGWTKNGQPQEPEPSRDATGVSGGIMCGDGGCAHLTAEEGRAIWDAVKQQQAERRARYPDEATALRAMFDAFVTLKEMGWREAIYAPCDGTPLDVIEVGSTGIHFATRDAERRFWIHDDNTWPSRPCLFRLRASLTDVEMVSAVDLNADRIRAMGGEYGTEAKA
jgi:hypothetical protein